MSKNNLEDLKKIELTEEELKKHNRRSFLAWGIFSSLGAGGFFLLRSVETERGLLWPLRKIMDFQDSFWKARFDENSRASNSAIPNRKLRVNGTLGMLPSVEVATWKLKVNSQGKKDLKLFSLNEIKALPKVTETFELKCVEGWSQPMTCTGVRFLDFMESLNVGWTNAESTTEGEDLFPFDYAKLSTIDGQYYVSMDMKSLMHPQTLLCYEINGETLALENGFPLRLISSVKYGVKNIKQLGEIEFTASPPADYWAENGYSEYLGL